MEDVKDTQEEEIVIIPEEGDVGVETSGENQDTQKEEDVLDDDNEEEEEKPQHKKNKTASYIEKLKAENKKLKSQLKTSSSDIEEEGDVDGIDRIALLEFKIDNPDASKYMDDIKAVIAENPKLGLQRAYSLVKMEKGESTSVNNFSISNKKVVRKKLSELNQEEAIKQFANNPTGYMNWRKAVGKI